MSTHNESEIKLKFLKRKKRLALSNLPEYPAKCATPSSERSSTPISECRTSLPLVRSKAQENEILHSKQCSVQSKQPSSVKNPRKDNIINAQQQPACYEYIKLNDVQQLFPLESGNLINIYGIIVSYNEDGIMIIKDETCDRFRFYPNLPTSIANVRLTTTIELVTTDESPTSVNENNCYSFQTGDIIRVHRLTLNRNLMHRTRALRNIVIFESFGDEEQFRPISVAENPTIEVYDHERVEELNRWQISNLLEEPLAQSLSKNRECDVINAALLVWNVFDFEKRTVVCCWTPSSKLVSEHPCYLLMSFNSIYSVMEENENRHSFSHRLIDRIYYKNQLIFLIIFGKHRDMAIKLKCCDTIICYQIVRKPDNFYPGHFSYILHDTSTYGQCIRLAHPNSLIAKKMREKMIEYVQNPPEILNMDQLDQDHMYAFNENLRRYNSMANQDNDEEQQEFHNQNQTTENLVTNETQNESKMAEPFFNAESESCTQNDNGLSLISNTALPNQNYDSFSLISNEPLPDQNDNLVASFSPKSSNDTTELVMALDPSLSFDVDDEEIEIINRHLNSRGSKLPREKIPKSYFILHHSMHQLESLFIGERVLLECCLYTYYGQTQKGDRFFDSIERLHSFATVVMCQNDYHLGRNCGYQSSFETYRFSVNEPPDKNFTFRCPNCNQFTCELCLDLTIILKDCYGNLLECHWTGLDSNRYFGCSSRDLYTISTSQPTDKKPLLLVRINALLKYLWRASRTSSDKYDRHIVWTVLVCRSKQPGVEVEYQILNVDVYKTEKNSIFKI